MRIGDENFQFKGEDETTAVLKIHHLLEFDRFQIMGPGNERMHLNFDTTYRRLPGAPTIVVPLSDDPMSAYNWAGTIWTATAKGTFSARYDDGTFSVKGTMDSASASPLLPWQGLSQGHMGHERNGVFLHREERSEE